jgi:peptidoglycan hydrolase-like protein with peptidoglycan-binding domain
MAVITKTIQPGEKSSEVTDMQKALIKLGVNIASGELFTATTAGTYGPSTQAAIVALYTRFNFLVFPGPTFEAATGRLLNLAVAAEAGSTAALRTAVRECFAALGPSPGVGSTELGWLARYAAIARDFTTARKLLDMILANSPIMNAAERERVGSVVNLSTLQPPAPEVLNPENYYTVLYDYVPRETINFLVRGA